MVKSTFSPFSPQLTQKMTKNHSNLIIKSGVKMRSHLTTKRGDSGSAGSLGQKCVMNQAPNLDTKIIQNQSPTLKSDKNHQNQQNMKNDKIKKIRKV